MRSLAELMLLSLVAAVAWLILIAVLRRTHGEQSEARRLTERIKCLVVSSDVSGDVLLGALVRPLREKIPGIQFVGFGGDRLKAAKVAVLADPIPLSLMGVSEIGRRLFELRRWWRIARKARKALWIEQPNLALINGGSVLSLTTAKEARRRRVRCVFFGVPQTWAWHWRGRRLDRILETVCTSSQVIVPLLPFEAKLYRDYVSDRKLQTKVVFEGHPFVDTVKRRMSTEAARLRFSLPPATKTIGLFPGSRQQELRYLLDDILAAAEIIATEVPTAFLMFVAETYLESALRNEIDENIKKRRLACQYVNSTSQDKYDAMGSCDVLITKSGVVTLEAACLGVPAVVVYRMPPADALLARCGLARITLPNNFMALPNILAGEELYRELKQDEVEARAIASAALRVLQMAPDELNMISEKLALVRGMLGTPGVLERIADGLAALTYDQAWPAVVDSRTENALRAS